MSQHFILLAFLLLLFVGQINAKFIRSEYEDPEDPFSGEGTDEPPTTEETEKPKTYSWRKIYEKCMIKFDDHKKCCDVSGGGDECLLGDTTEEAGETTPEGPEYSDEAFEKCLVKLKQSKSTCCFIFEDKQLEECEDQQQTTTETTEDVDTAYSECIRRGYNAEECCAKYPLATQCIATTTEQTANGGGTAEEFKRCKEVCYLETCCELFDYNVKLEECGFLKEKQMLF